MRSTAVLFVSAALLFSFGCQSTSKPVNDTANQGTTVAEPAPPKERKSLVPKNVGATELRGTLRTGMMAIGGETTGAQIVTESGDSIEIQWSHRKDLETWKGKKVHAWGKSKMVKGVEIPFRRIFEVERIELDGNSAK